MLRSFLVLFIYCVVLSVAQAAVIEDYQGCGPNEVYNGCNPCPPEVTCDDDDHYICTRLYNSCQAGCVCKQGFIRKSVDGECIPEMECSRRCGKNEIYTECKQSCLNETCASIGSPSKCDSKEPCKPGCICINGFFRKDEEDVEDPGCVIPRCLCLQMEGSPACSPWELHEPGWSYLG